METRMFFRWALMVCLQVCVTMQAQTGRCLHMGWQQGMKSGKVTDMAQDQQGRIWMATEGGLHCWDGYRFTVYQTDDSPLTANELNAVLADSDGRHIWIGTRHDGLCRLDVLTGGWQVFRQEDGLPSDGITRLTHASDGGIWVTCYLDGVCHIGKDGEMTNYTSENVKGLPSPNWTALDDGRGTLYVGHVEKGLSMVDLRTKQCTTLLKEQSPSRGFPLIDNEVLALCLDPIGRIWAGTRSGISVWSPQEGCITENRQTRSNVMSMTRHMGEIIWGELNEGVYAVMEDCQGNLWRSDGKSGVNVECHDRPLFADSDTLLPSMTLKETNHINDFLKIEDETYVASIYGLWVVDAQGKAVCREDINSQMDIGLITGIAADRQGKLWIGTFGAGLYVFQPDGRLVAHLPTIPSVDINKIILDSQGRIWAATHDGLALFADTEQPELTRLYQHADGLQSNLLYAVCEDQKGRIWTSSGDGISCLNLKDGMVKNYTYADGIPYRTFVPGQTGLLPNGNIVFGQNPGGCLFDPDYVEQKRTLAPIFISSFTLFGKNAKTGEEERKTITPAEWQEGISFAHNDNSFRITLGIADISQADEVEYQYSLEGLDDQWYDVGSDRTFLLPSLPPGSYRLLIRARIKNDEWGNNYQQSLSFTIRQPWWWTGWMRLLYITLISAFLWWQWKLYRQRQLFQRLQTGRIAAIYATSEKPATSSITPPITKEDEGKDAPRLLDRQFLERLDRIILERLDDENLDSEVLTQQLCTSYSTLYRKIKSLTGMSVNEYIRKHRLTKAMQLLRDGYNVSEVAMRCGFTSQGYFRRCFKEEYGILPSKV